MIALLQNEFFMIMIYFVDSLIAFFYARRIYSLKYHGVITFILYFATNLLLMLSSSLIDGLALVKWFLTLMLNILIIKLLYVSSYKSSLFHGTMLTTAKVLSYYLASRYMGFFPAISENTGSSYNGTVIIAELLYFLLSFIFANVSAKETNTRQWGKWFGLSVLPLASIYVITVLSNMVYMDRLSKKESISLLSVEIVLLLLNIVTYMLYEKIEQDNQKLTLLELANQKNEIDMQYLNLLERKNDQLHILTHDFRNHIQTLKSLSEASEVSSYLANVTNEINENRNLISTKNPLLDVILDLYHERCKDKKVHFIVTTTLENFSFMEGQDLASLIGNLMDNALEAATKSTERNIKMEISRNNNGYASIVVVNSCDETPNVKNGRLLSKKKGDFHGYGMRSIDRIVSKYKGDWKWNYEKARMEFTTLIVIPITD